MAGLVPAIHVLSNGKESKDVDHRDKRGDDGFLRGGKLDCFAPIMRWEILPSA
jgi:hypothetical protein